jgi:hypothetical protein
MLSRRSKLRVALMAAMSLLFAQFGAQAHAYSHIHPGSDSSQQLDPQGRLCAQCQSFAPLLATAGSPSHSLFVSFGGVIATPAVTVDSLVSRTQTPAFRSRAPPSAL